MPKLLFIPGSLRAASSARATVRTLADAIASEAEVRVAEIGALPHYNADLKDDPTVAAFVKQVGEADGVVIVTPEYNYSIPGALKNAIDWASRPAFASVFKDKPCLVVSVSGGALGGVRAQGHLKYVLNGMLSKVQPSREIVVPFANDKVRDGVLVDEAIVKFAVDTLREFMAGL